MKKIILFFAVLFFAATAQATGHVHTTNTACEKSDGFYMPTIGMTEAVKAKKFAGWKEATLDRDQCLQTVARENGADRRGHVRMQKGTKVLVSGNDVVIAECGNAIFTKVSFTFMSLSTIVPSQDAVAYTPDVSRIETIGGERCNFYSDGTLRLKANTKQVLAKGEKVTPSVMQRDLPNGQTCQQWREEFQKKYTHNPTRVVQM